MFNRIVVARAVMLGLVALLGTSLGCGSPNTPAPVVQVQSTQLPAPTITSLIPNQGLAGVATFVQVHGTGFLSGATVTLDGNATNVLVSSETFLTATTPVHAVGTVDAVVTNPNGQSGKLAGGFAYKVVTLTASVNVVSPGAQLSVTWVAPGRINPGIDGDWIGLFRVDDPNTSAVWEKSTTGATGTFALSAPIQPGAYEFRYLLGEDYIDVARSSPVTVTAPPIAALEAHAGAMASWLFPAR